LKQEDEAAAAEAILHASGQAAMTTHVHEQP